MNPVVKSLIELLGEDIVVYGDRLSERATSYWDSAPTQALALIRPKTTEQVSTALRICHQFDQPVVTQGGLTGCVEGAVADKKEIIISLERMTDIEDIDVLGGTITVQAGAILQTVQETLADQGLLFPLDLGARGTCTIGGNVATNAGGISVLRYGMMRNNVLGLEAVLADGTIMSSMNKMLKNNAGYDLKQLFIGSEGTLGIVTRVVINISPLPLSCQSALVAMNSFEQVTSLLHTLKRDLAGTLSAYEVMWGNYYSAVTNKGGHRPPLDREYSFYVVLEATGADQEADQQRFEQVLEKAFEEEIIVDAVIPKSESERRHLWDIRENFDVILETQPTYLYDVSLPITEMATYIEKVEQNIKDQWPQSKCYVLGHIADGNLHLFVQPHQEGDCHNESDIAVYTPLKSINGSVSAEHGIGMEKKKWLEHSRSATEVSLMKLIKNTLDPKGLLNPQRVLDS